VKAFILAAGFGKRLKKLTQETPKPLVEILDIPLIIYTLHILKEANIKDVIINLHYKGEKIKKYLGDGSKFGFNFTYSYEKEILGTGGGIKNVEHFFDGEEDFVVINSDIISNLNLKGVISSHKKNNSIVTLATKTNVKKDLFFDQNNNLLAIANEIDSKAFGVFTGVQILNKEIFKYLKSEFSSSITAFRQLISEKRSIKVCPVGNAFWYDFGIIENNQSFEKELQNNHSKFLKGVLDLLG
jgi:mannose-1-phosphate guanylyltransferase